MQGKMDNMEERMSSHQKETESEIRKVSARQVNFELEMARLKETIDNEFVEVHNNMQAIKKEMEEAASRSKTLMDQGVIDAAWAEVASKQVDAKLDRVENEVREMNKALLEAKEASAEAQDKEARRNNIILYRVPENADGNDKRFCEQLLVGMNVGVVEEDIKRVHSGVARILCQGGTA